MRKTAPLALAGALVLAACGTTGGRTTSPSGSTMTSELARADVPRANVPPDAAISAVPTVNGLGVDLYRLLAAQPGNIVLSPSSIATALAMARAGAAGTTAAEMDRVLHVTDPALLATAMNALDQALAARSGAQPAADGSTVDVTLTSANSLWGQQGLPFTPAFLQSLAASYGAGMRLVDYRNDPDAARQAINAWVASQTGDRIKELLAPGALDQRTRLALVNAVYLKAPWLFPFEPSLTADAPFTKLDGSVVQVPLMHQSEALAYAKGDGWQAVQLPYAGAQLAMTVIVPDAGTFASFEQAFTTDVLDRITRRLGRALVTLALPKWDTKQGVSLADVLARAGMPTAFTDAADFSGMTTAERLMIDKVEHQANITVDESGTEAAAATAVIMRPASAPPAPAELTVDRPFLFALRDATTGAVLFLGRVVDPSGR